MKTDGQLYTDEPVGPPPRAIPEQAKLLAGIGKEELLLLGLILLLTSEKKSADLPLIIALIYILL